MSALVDALCAPPPPPGGCDAALIYDTFNAASCFLFDGPTAAAAAALCDGIVVGPGPAAPAQPQEAGEEETTMQAATSSALASRAGRKRRRRARSCKSREETETQRMTHIAVERNRRRQMNEYLAVLRSLMPEAYVQRGDQASIVGGAIEFVKELEQQVQCLEAQKRTLLVHQQPVAPNPPAAAAPTMRTANGGASNAAAGTAPTPTACVDSTAATATATATTSNDCSSSVTEDAAGEHDAPSPPPPPFAHFFTYPQYVWCQQSPRDPAAGAAEDGRRPGVADIEVTLVETHASLRVMAPRRPGQLLSLVTGLQQALRLSVLHLTATTLDALVLYSISVRGGCCTPPGRGISPRHLARQVGGRAALLLAPQGDDMVRIIEHNDDVVPPTEEVATFTPQHPPSRHAARTPQASHHHASSVAAPMGRQRAPSRASRASAHVANGGPLAAARELLHNPPPPGASPDAMAQWQSDVDRLIHLAQNTPGLSRAGGAPPSSHSTGARRRQQGAASRSVQSPSVRGARTEDLRAELDRRRAGEDARHTLERGRERRRNLEGRDLDSDLVAEVSKPPAGTPASPGVTVAGVGCAALADHLRAAKWPAKFRPHLPEKYDGSTNPSEFLQVYVTAITAAGGDDAVMASYFHVALTGPARTWLMNLSPGTIRSWEELCAQFTANFASACQQYGCLRRGQRRRIC